MKYAGGLKMLDILVWLDVQYLRQFSGHSLRMSFLQHSIFKAYWVCPEILVYTTLVKRTFNMKVRPSFFFFAVSPSSIRSSTVFSRASCA
jgi:hypothetical protein